MIAQWSQGSMVLAIVLVGLVSFDSWNGLTDNGGVYYFGDFGGFLLWRGLCLTL